MLKWNNSPHKCVSRHEKKKCLPEEYLLFSDEQERFCRDEELFHLSSHEKTNFPLRRTFMYFSQEELTLRVCSKTFCWDAHISARPADFPALVDLEKIPFYAVHLPRPDILKGLHIALSLDSNKRPWNFHLMSLCLYILQPFIPL